jgi:alpha-1,3-mannosyltransferase
MRICHVVDSLTWTGGVQEYVANLARSQAELGHDVTILCTGDPEQHAEYLNPAARGLDVVWHGTTKLAGRITVPKGMMRSIRQQTKMADIVHVHQAFFLGTWMAMLSRERVAATCYLHPIDIERGRKRLRRTMLKVLLWRTDLVVCVSQSELTLLSQLRHPRRSCVIWPGLSSIPESSQTRRPLVLSVARLSVDKGIDTLIPACGLIARGLPVAIVGLNVDPLRVEQLRADACLPESALLGSLPDEIVDELYGSATIFVSASRQESFGIAALKAIAGGCHPLLSDIPSHREIVTTLGLDEQCLFDPAIAPHDLAERILAAAAQGPMPAPPHHLMPTWQTSAKTLLEQYEGTPRRRHPTHRQ